MENKLLRKSLSVLVIIAMVASIFAIPAFTNTSVDAGVKKVKVKFYANGGKFTTKKNAKKKIVTKKVLIYGKIGKMPKVTRKGYTFKGWYVKKKGGYKDSKHTIVTKTKKLYARWAPKKYAVYFDEMRFDEPVNGKYVKYNSKYGKLPTPSINGCQFLGWYTKPYGGTKITSATKFKNTKTTTLYAHWDIDVFEVAPDAIKRIGQSVYNFTDIYEHNIEEIITQNEGYLTFSSNNTPFDYMFDCSTKTCVMVFENQKIILPRLESKKITHETYNKYLGNPISLEGVFYFYRHGNINICVPVNSLGYVRSTDFIYATYLNENEVKKALHIYFDNEFE